MSEWPHINCHMVILEPLGLLWIWNSSVCTHGPVDDSALPTNGPIPKDSQFIMIWCSLKYKSSCLVFLLDECLKCFIDYQSDPFIFFFSSNCLSPTLNIEVQTKCPTFWAFTAVLSKGHLWSVCMKLNRRPVKERSCSWWLQRRVEH